MLKASLRKFGSDAAVAAPPAGAHVPAGKGNHSGQLGWFHIHREWNYRKKPLGWKAYSKENMDLYAPFGFTAPGRHIDRPFPGSWYAGGHNPHPKYMNGPYMVGIKIAAACYVGVPLGLIGWYRKVIHLGNWEVKNKGAVSGTD